MVNYQLINQTPIKRMKKNSISEQEALECVKKLIQFIGDDPDRPGLEGTPERVINAYKEIFRGYEIDSASVLKSRFRTQSKEIIVLSDIELYSTCEHHLLPFFGKCHIAYLPNGRVIGISKLARLIDVFARRLQIQEELTFLIATTLEKELETVGVAVVIEAQHMCMTCRGVNKQNSIMTTSMYLKEFKKSMELRAEFHRLIHK